MADLKAKFDQAVADSKSLPEKPDNMTLLKLYALYKQASSGDADGKRPGFADMVGRAKWDAWNAVKGQSSDEAMQAYDGSAPEIDLVMTDLVMPRMGGRELSEMLHTLRPDLKTIFMSGYTDDAVVRYGVRDAGLMFLQKPFSMAWASSNVPSRAMAWILSASTVVICRRCTSETRPCG